MAAAVSCSVVIATCERAESLAITLEALGHQTYRDFEVIVVSDGEDPATRGFSQRYAPDYPIRWIFKTQRAGLAAARNTGVGGASGGMLLFLDDDITACPDWLLRHWERRRSMGDAELLVVGGQMRNAFPRPAESRTEGLLREASDRALAEFHARCLRTGGEFDWAPHCGVNSSVSRDLFLRVGGFDERAGPLHEDNECGARLQSLGARFIYEPDALVHHRNPKNLADWQGAAAAFAAQSDWYRVVEKNQRLSQTQRLTSYHYARPLRRWKEHLAWKYPGQTQAVANGFRKAADATGSRFLGRYWSALETSAKYWEAIRAEGATPEMLGDLIGNSLPILMFHSISEPATECEREWGIDPGRFRKFAAWLVDRRYPSIIPEEWSAGNRTPGVMLTFDDGFEDFYSEAYPVLERFGLRSTVFVVWERIGQTNTWDRHLRVRQRQLMNGRQIREMHRFGVNIGSHSMTHACLPTLSDQELRREVRESKLRLEDLVGDAVKCFAYPSGRVDARVRAAVAEAGYTSALAVGEGLNLWGDPFLMPRINISSRDSMANFALKVTTGRGISENLVHLLARGVRSGLSLLPPGLSESLGTEIRASHQAMVRRWWQWKEAQFVRQESPRPSGRE